jgi:tRNA dimethylallyltransferase
MSKPKIVAVVGHTASGKTGLAIALAERLGGEIVCCDSMQIYKTMDIGTAKPTPEELARVPHHTVDFVDPMRPYSCADYASDAEKAINDILSRGKLPVICGGTGLYLDTLLFERPFDECGGRSDVRERLEREAVELGAHALHMRLSEVDPESAEKIHENNVRRVIRALEIYETTGFTKTSLDETSRAAAKDIDILVLALEFHSRETLYSRIDRRVDEMMEEGLLDEVKSLYEAGLLDGKTTASQAIGYKELLSYIKGESTLPEALEFLKQSTRRYAKRQLTWFRHVDAKRIMIDDELGREKKADEILAEALEIIKTFYKG